MIIFSPFLGTTYSSVAVYRNYRAEILENDQGNRLTPSCVAFTDVGRLVGEGALEQAARNPSNTVFGKVSALILTVLSKYLVCTLAFKF